MELTGLLKFLNKSQALYATDYANSYNVPFDLLEMCLNSNSGSDFLGTILVQKIDDGSYYIIDGLQRITTVSLLLYALCERYKRTTNKNTLAISKIHSRYLKNSFGAKLQLNAEDKIIYEKIINSKKLSDIEKQHNLFKALHYFWQRIKNDSILATDLFKTLFNIVVLLGEAPSENLNLTDVYCHQNYYRQNLNQVDMITNYIISRLGTNSLPWQDVIEQYKKLDLSFKLEDFIHDYLIVQRVNCDGNLYLKFKTYLDNAIKTEQVTSALLNIKKYAHYYIKMIQAEFLNYEVKKQFTILNEGAGIQAYPYILEIMDDLETKKMTTEIFVEILLTINMFITEKGVNIDFTTLSEEINKRILN